MLSEISSMYGRKSREEIMQAYRNIDASEVFKGENMALHLACSYGDSDAVAILIENGANVNAQNKYGWTPLQVLAKLDEAKYTIVDGEVRKCAELLFNAKASVLRKDNDGSTSIIEAAKWGRHELLEVAVQKGAKLSAVDKDGNNALHALCTQVSSPIRSLKSAQEAVENLTDRDSESRRQSKMEDLAAAQKEADGYYLSAKALIDGGMDIDEKNNYNQTPLDIAIKSSAKKIAALLAGEYSADGAVTGGMNIFQAIVKKDYEALKAIINKGVELNELNDTADNYKGLTPLAIACLLADAESIRILLEAGADPDFKNSAGRTALAEWFKYGGDTNVNSTAILNKVPQAIIKLFKTHKHDFNAFCDAESNTPLSSACRLASSGNGVNGIRFYRVVAETLLNMGCDVNTVNLKGQTPLMFVCSQDDSNIGNLQLALLEQGADANAVDKAGNTPLHYCAENRSANTGKEMAESLFEFDVTCVNAVNNAGKTALEIATDKNNEPLVKLLLMNS